MATTPHPQTVLGSLLARHLTPSLATPDQAKVRTARNDMLADIMKVYGVGRCERLLEKLGGPRLPHGSHLPESSSGRRSTTVESRFGVRRTGGKAIRASVLQGVA